MIYSKNFWRYYIYMSYLLSWSRRSLPTVIGSAASGSGALFPSDEDNFQTVKVASKKGSFVSQIQRGFKRIAARIQKNPKVIPFEWKMNGKDWTIPQIRKLKLADWKKELEEPNPIRIEVLVKDGGGFRVVSNVFHLVFPNNQPVTGQPKTLDTPESLLEGAKEKMKKGDPWKAVKRYYKYLKQIGKRPRQVEQLEQLFNSDVGRLAQMRAVFEAMEKVKLSRRNVGMIKDEVEKWMGLVSTLKQSLALFRALKAAKSRMSVKALGRIRGLLDKRLKKEGKQAMSRLRIKL